MKIDYENLKLFESIGLNRDIAITAVYVLFKIKEENETWLKMYIDEDINKNSIIVLKELQKCNLIEYKEKFIITKNGLDLLEQVNEKVIKEKIVGIDCSEWIEDYLKLWKDFNNVFYKDKNRSLGCSKRDAISQMNKFIKEYNYLFENTDPKSIILNATKNFINSAKSNNFAYCPNAFYFIAKQGQGEGKKSKLALECENLEIIKNPIIRKKSVNE